MSTDARLYQEDDGWAWSGTHDGDDECRETHDVPSPLVEKIQEIEKCYNDGRMMRWEIRPFLDGHRLSGWSA